MMGGGEILWFAAIVAVIVLLFAIDRRRSRIICPNPNCGYKGQGRKSGGSSGCLLIVLLLLGILPGLIYLLIAGSPGVICPKCGVKIR